MPAVTLGPEDFEPFAEIDPFKAAAMIEDALALAARIAPCIAEDDFAYDAAAKAILRRAILRWNDAGSGAVIQQGAGPFQQSVDNRQEHKRLFWPTEIAELQDMCRTDATSGAFSIDTAPGVSVTHSETCSLVFGADYCDCGASIAGFPLYS